MTGLHLSHYAIESELGRGGMGIVFRAKDTKLNRTVALKVLPAGALASEDDRARFRREAQAAAQLNHPNVCHVYQVDEAQPLTPDGKPVEGQIEPRLFIAMEYIEGQTLHDYVKKGPLKLQEAVNIAGQVAEALKAAHAKDIVHRDIKSANVMLAPDGVAKVLDFGLAKTQASTMLTHLGSTLGTVAYMSPEQARGEEVDGRSDLYSLGTVLYEMIAGRLPFAGNYEQAILYSILNEDPEPLTAIRTGVPMELERVATKLLNKVADFRYQSAAGLLSDLNALDLANLRQTRPSMVAATQAASNGTTAPTPRWVWAGMAAALMVGALAAWLAKPTPVPEAQPTVRFSIESEQPGYLGRRSVAITPDGASVAVVTTQGLELRHLSNLDQVVPIPGLPSLRGVFASADSEWLGFENLDDPSLMRVLMTGGAPLRVASLPGGLYGADWNENGDIYVGLGELGMARVPSSGGELEMITPDSLDGSSYRAPQLLPDGKTLLYTLRPASPGSTREIRLLNLDNNDDRLLHTGGNDAQYLESGHIVFEWGGTLYAFGFDADRGTKLGDHVPVGVSVWTQFGGTPQFDVSSDGTMVKIPRREDRAEIQLAWLEADGSTTPASSGTGRYERPIIHPDGRQIVFYQGGYLWLLDGVRGTPIRLSNGWSPVWSREGDRLAFGSGDGFLVMQPSVSEDLETLWTKTVPTESAGPTSWSPDGRFLAFNQWSQAGARVAVHLLDLESGETLPFLEPNSIDATISPDGRWIAYGSDESGNNEVYVRRFPSGQQRLLISDGGGKTPQWRPDGRAIYFHLIDRPALAQAEVNLETGQISPTQVLLDGPVSTGSGFGVHAIDGRPLLRLLSGEAEEPTRAPRIEIAMHWTSHLEAATSDQ